LEEEVEVTKEQNQKLQGQLSTETLSLTTAKSQIEELTTEISSKVKTNYFIDLTFILHFYRLQLGLKKRRRQKDYRRI